MSPLANYAGSQGTGNPTLMSREVT